MLMSQPAGAVDVPDAPVETLTYTPENVAGATMFVVAQRVSTVLHADQIIVLDSGRIAGIGKHEDLLSSCEAYQELVGSQLEVSA